MKFIGITGTNGKTTITCLLQHILTKAGYNVGVIGTLTGKMTTPSPWDLAEIIAQFQQEKKDYVVMEVSSHGIHQDRIKGIFFHIKLLTNITQDHLDYHKTIQEYRQVKLGWMKRGQGIKIYPKHFRREKINFKHSFLGKFNHKNIQAALAITRALNIPEAIVRDSFLDMPKVPGRFENIACGQDFHVIVDYAHTPDGLENVLSTARAILKKEKKRGRIITLFGCGGDRDKTKRPIMGEISHRLSNISIITSDNPRSEDPQEIINNILSGFPKKTNSKHQIIIEPDRHQAIRQAIKLARSGDLVLLAGKGHENYQIFKDQRIHFDDREEAQAMLKIRVSGQEL